ncbi:MAG: CPBP family intramembrane metalloprotease [Steroidobacteraceae bacterium]|nr:CPBP family intramembrane metalloprotease [Steroidobacteraceae bacterium]
MKAHTGPDIGVQQPLRGFRLGLLLWFVGMPGVVAVTATLLPVMLAGQPLPMPLWVLALLSLVQNGVILALAVWAGVALAPAVGLHAPVLGAAITRSPLGPVLRPQLLPGLVVGLLGGAFLFGAWRLAPDVLASVQERLSLPLFARVLYGGITEELLLRWGLMTVLVWLGWACLQRRRAAPAAGLIWIAIVMSALVFGAGHLPAAAVLAGPLDAAAVAWVLGFNTTFGLLFGYLFWRYGLESAMIAHGLAHVVHYLAETV